MSVKSVPSSAASSASSSLSSCSEISIEELHARSSPDFSSEFTLANIKQEPRAGTVSPILTPPHTPTEDSIGGLNGSQTIIRTEEKDIIVDEDFDDEEEELEEEEDVEEGEMDGEEEEQLDLEGDGDGMGVDVRQMLLLEHANSAATAVAGLHTPRRNPTTATAATTTSGGSATVTPKRSLGFSIDEIMQR
uniref:Uncharacterized protein n=1 Tax=Anopheles epiroticus TaxID=199890 RepID=A0A182PD07_9DIPT